jgi:hypothetical protein
VEEFFLIYINYVGRNYEGNYFYEFIFSDTTDDVDGADWDTYPASGRPQPPDEFYIKKVGRLESELNLDVIQNSDTFAVWDAVDDVIALAWENVNAYETYPDKRLSFRFGETITETQNKLYEKDLILKYTK